MVGWVRFKRKSGSILLDNQQTVNPFDESTIGLIKYGTDGTIYSDNQAINMDLNNTLNLNYNGPGVYLKSNRQEALEACKDKLKKNKKQGLWSKSMLQQMLAEYERPDAEGKLKPYSGIVVAYLKSKIHKL